MVYPGGMSRALNHFFSDIPHARSVLSRAAVVITALSTLISIISIIASRS